MYEFHPYITNDGSIGLFSPQDDDIYHSTYGALSESWQKFVKPAHLEEYIGAHDTVKILDVCYGIGYNTKTALQTFINYYLKNKKNFNKNYSPVNLDIASIDTDNIRPESLPFLKKNNSNNCQKSILETQCNETIGGDNICCALFNADLHEAEKKLAGLHDNLCSKKKFLVDAIDVNKELFSISPFLKNQVSKFKFHQDFKNHNGNKIINQISKITNSKKIDLPKRFRIDCTTNIVLLTMIVQSIMKTPDNFKLDFVKSIYSKKEFAPLLDKFVLNLFNFLINPTCVSSFSIDKSTFLHNIYYRYVSRSYKIAKKLLLSSEIELNFHMVDARSFITKTQNTYNFIFLDAFTPAKCPTLWSYDFFCELYSKLEPDGLLLTYSNATTVRSALLRAGFYVGKIYDNKLKKIIGTIAAKNPDLIEHKLSQKDMVMIKSTAGIPYRDKQLNLDNSAIIKNRLEEVKNSDLISSSQAMKGFKNDEKNDL